MKILIATDGSKFSDAAVEAVCKYLKNSEIKIISVYEPPILTAGAPYILPAGYNPVLEQELSHLATEAVAKAKQNICEYFPESENNLTTQIICGSPKQIIIEEADAWGADLIVVGSHGYGFWERMFLGSVSSAVVHNAHCSVLIVRSQNDS